MQVKKSEKASLEKDKLVYVLMGLVFVLSLVYVALEWTEREVTKYEVTDTASPSCRTGSGSAERSRG